MDAQIEAGHHAFERGDAESAQRAFEAALAQRESGEVLEGLARAHYLAGDYRGSIESHERSFAAYREEGDPLSAARSARILSWLHVNLHADFAVAGGWLTRAESVLDQAGKRGTDEGWLELMRATREPHGDGRVASLESAVALGRGAGDADLEYAALAQPGEALVMTGRIEEGMARFDESLAAICAGEVHDLYVLEGVFCGLYLTCERVHDVVRAEQWLRAAGELVRRRNLVAVGPLCRAHYGGLLTAAGRWEEAEAELDDAARLFEGGYAAARAMVLVRLADLRIRQGRLEEAAVLLEGLDQIPDAARPLAALHLARGETGLARHILERRLALPVFPAPWPIAPANPSPPPVAAPLLALLVDVCLAEGDTAAASETADRLATLAERHRTAYLRGAAALAKGRICVASGSDDVKACLRDALAAFSAAQMPLELARARLELARSLAEAEPEVAIAEAKAALDAFERAQAARDADIAASLLRSLGAPTRSAPKGREPLSKRESEVLELLGHGLSNPEIAERLFISRKTAEHHVSNILLKLGLRNRAQAAAYAARTAAEEPANK